MKPSTSLVATLAAALLAGPLVAAPPAQDDVPAAKPDDVERFAEWPALEKDVAKVVKKDVSRLRKARTPEMGSQAHEALVAAGPGVAPALLTAMSKEKGEEALARIAAVLTAVTDERCTRLLAKEFGHKHVGVRMWAQRRAAAFPDAGTREQALAALAKAKALSKKDKAAKDEVYVAALAVVASGSTDGLSTMLKTAKRRWGKFGAEMRTALEAVRGPEATGYVHGKLADADREEKVAALRVLSGCGDESATAIVRPYLDDTDNSIRVAAINALRGIVDGDPPLDKLPVFKAIELAKKWKSRV